MAADDADFRRKQVVAVTLSIAAALLVACVGTHALAWFGARVPAQDDPATRLAFAFRWLLAPGTLLLAGIVVASRRGFYRDAIDGTRTPTNRGLEIGLRYNQNTLEQTLLVVIAWPALCVSLPHAQLAFVPAMAVLFVAGRVTFWLCYLVYPAARAFGMTMTALPTLASYGWMLAGSLS